MKKDLKKFITSFISEVHKCSDNEDPIDKLEKMGYTEKEINEAIESVFSRNFDIPPVRKFKRVLSESEKLNLSIEAQGYVIQLLDSEIISEPELGILLETISIERFYPATLSDVKRLVRSFSGDLTDNFRKENSPDNIKIN
ncbi:MAG TPA: DUF494 family protein [Candidatus Krumholzibacteriaceae bacterium]|nr:DUF494 family protein [Candidatus Krumholzibacteriaceae bacterium]